MRLYRRIIALSLVLLAMGLQARAQNISVSAGPSRALYDSRYYDNIFGKGVAPTFPTFTIRYGREDYSGSPVSAILKHPEVGIGFQFDALNSIKTVNDAKIGNMYSLFAYIDRPVIVWGGFKLGYTGEFGLGFMFRNRYNEQTNPYNVIISAPVNAHITLGLQATYDITPKYNAGLGFYFNHHSNGSVYFPNYGLNQFELKLKVGVKTPPGKEQLAQQPIDDGFRRRFLFSVQASGGVMSDAINNLFYDGDVADNHLHFKYAFQVNGLYKYARTHASGLGVDLYVTPFCDVFESDGKGNDYKPVSVGISLLHEFCYNNFSLMLGLGKYLYHNDGLEVGETLYQQVLVKYYFPQLADFYLGAVLKAHRFKAAESIQLCIGKRF